MKDLELCNMLGAYSVELENTEGLRAKGMVQLKHARLIRDAVKNCSIPDVRLSCFKEVFEKFQEIEHESEFYGWLHAKAHEA
jgi:hypothetical protein